MSLKEKIASLLDALADERESNPGLPSEPERVREDEVGKFAESYRAATGEDLSDELRARLEGDDVLRNAISKVAGVSSQRPTPLGEAMDHEGGSEESRSKSKEAAERHAYDRFATGIMALGQR
jgi:hypothetical protein